MMFPNNLFLRPSDLNVDILMWMLSKLITDRMIFEEHSGLNDQMHFNIMALIHKF